jgi:hypothetical protein
VRQGPQRGTDAEEEHGEHTNIKWSRTDEDEDEEEDENEKEEKVRMRGKL